MDEAISAIHLLLLALSLVWVLYAAPSHAHTEQELSLPDIAVDEKLGKSVAEL
jgi:hypothetical protein